MRNWMNNLKLSTKLSSILILAALAIGVSNLILIQNSNSTTQQLEKELYDELYYSTYYLLNADRDFFQADQAFTTYQTDETLTSAKAEALKQDYEENLNQVKDKMTQAKNILLGDNGLDQNKMESNFNSFFEHLSIWENETSQLLAGNNEEISAFQIERLREQFNVTRDHIDFIQQDLEDSAINTVDLLQEENQSSIMVSMAITALCVIVVFVLGFLLIRSITKPVTQLVHIFQQVSDGSLQVERFQADRKDEIGQLASASNVMIDNLREMVRKIQDISQTVSYQSEELTQSANTVRSGTEQVASTMEQLSAGAEEQASSSNEISNLIEELNQQIRQSNEDGNALEDASQEVYQMSNEGKEEMGRSVALMNEITTLVTESVDKVKDLDRRSGEISKLIEVIQNIAEQTNLLALNAAIEAARAGESGRGFAVVADEVRKLAEQVGASVTEITDIIEGIQVETKSMVNSLEAGHQRVEDGNQQIHISRNSFESISQAVSEMIGRIQNVSSNLNDIARNADKVNQSATEIASASEEAAAGIEESSATAEQQSVSMQEIVGNAEALTHLSEELNGLIKQFKL